MPLRDTAIMRAVNFIVRSPAVLRSVIRDRQVANREKHFFSVCAIKNESRFLSDWLTFHHGVGATHFFLYDNESTDNPSAVLSPWIDAGIVTLITWPGRAQQRKVYAHCVRTFWRSSRWIAFLDLDEFLFSPKQVAVRPILERYLSCSGLLVYWYLFGSSGHVNRPDCSVIEAYTMREESPRLISGKSIVNPRFVRRIPNAHNFALWKGATVDTNGTALPYDRFFDKRVAKTPVFDLLRIKSLLVSVTSGFVRKSRTRGWPFSMLLKTEQSLRFGTQLRMEVQIDDFHSAED